MVLKEQFDRRKILKSLSASALFASLPKNVEALTTQQRAALLGGANGWTVFGANTAFDFDYQGDRYSGGSLVSTACTRASIGTDLMPWSAAGAAYNTFAINAVRRTPGLGCLSEESRIQLSAHPTAPQNESINLASTGTYAIWVNGPVGSSLGVAAGTAVGSGFGTATNGNPVVLTITSAGTITTTVTGSLNVVQVEKCTTGSSGTSFMPTAGMTRAADRLSYDLSALGSKFSASVQSWYVRALWNASNTGSAEFIEGGNAASAYGVSIANASSGTVGRAIIYNGTNRGDTSVSGRAYSDLAPACIALSYDAGSNKSFAMNGTAYSSTQTPSELDWPGSPSLSIGGRSIGGGSLFANTYIQEIAGAFGIFFTSAFLQNATSTLRSGVAQANFATLGDSRSTTTQGYITPFVAAYVSRSVDTEAVGGQRSDEIAARFGAITTTCVVSGNQIPTSGSVSVSSLSPDLFHHWNSTTGAIHGSIGGVAGTLAYSSGTVTFLRDTTGIAVNVSNPVQFVPDSGTGQASTSAAGLPALTTLYADIAVIALGYNDIANGIISGTYTYSQAATLANIAACVASLSSGKYIVPTVFMGEALLVSGAGGIGVGESTLGTAPDQATALAAIDAVIALNAAITAAYPNNSADWQGDMAGTWGEVATVNGVARTILNSTALSDGIHCVLAAGRTVQVNGLKTVQKRYNW